MQQAAPDIERGPAATDEPVTLVISRRIKPQYEQAFEQCLAEVSRALTHFPGYMGSSIIRPSDHAHPEYVVILRFDTYRHLHAWEESPLRAAWLAQVRQYTEGEFRIEHFTGLEYWFSLPDKPHQTPPPRYKMVLVTMLGLYPLINIINPLLGTVLGDMPGPIYSLVMISILIPTMTYVVMPNITRLFARWLYPAGRK